MGQHLIKSTEISQQYLNQNAKEAAMYDNRSANMLGKVLIFLTIVLVILTAIAVLGLSDWQLKSAEAEGVRSNIRYQDAKRAAELQYAPQIAAAEANNRLASLQAQATKMAADAETYRQQQLEQARVIQEQNSQNLAQEEMISEALVYLGVAAGLVVILAAGFGLYRLIDRLLPAKPRAPRPRARAATQAPRSEAPQQPIRETPQRQRPMRQPVREPAPATPYAPQPVAIQVEDEQYRSISRNGNQPHRENGNRSNGHNLGRPLPAH
jgi:hypothetical protein